jgi:hypothetical protein
MPPVVKTPVGNVGLSIVSLNEEVFFFYPMDPRLHCLQNARGMFETVIYNARLQFVAQKYARQIVHTDCNSRSVSTIHHSNYLIDVTLANDLALNFPKCP